jgi:hypothetical protein
MQVHHVAAIPLEDILKAPALRAFSDPVDAFQRYQYPSIQMMRYQNALL